MYGLFMVRRALVLLTVVFWSGSARAAKLESSTEKAWNAYIAFTEARIDSELGSPDGFLLMQFLDPSERTECEREVRAGDVCVLERHTLDDEGNKIAVPYGMIHHWYGTVYVPGVSVDRVIELVQAYDKAANYYTEVEDSQLLSREGDQFDIFLRLRRTKVITVHYATVHRVDYHRRDDAHISSRSVATRIREIAKPGEPNESEKPEGDDRGFLWRLNSYWRFQETEEGTFVECESVSLSRDVPAAVRWLVKNFLDSVPKESLESTLFQIRDRLLIR